MRKPSKELGPLVNVDRLLAVEKLHITHKNSLAIGTKREVMYYTECINVFYAFFIVHMSTEVGKGQSPLCSSITNTFFQCLWLDKTHMKLYLFRRRGRNRFRLTETIYMKLIQYYIRNIACSYINHLTKTKCL